MLGITFLTMLATSATMGMAGVLMRPLQSQFGWDSGAISGAMAMRLVLYGLTGPFAAAMMLRYGLRRAVCAALFCITLGLLLITRMNGLWQLYIFWGLFVGVGTGMTAIVLGATVANNWFGRRRGMALGIVATAAASGAIGFVPISAWLAEHIGWRLSVAPPIVLCSLAFVLVALLARDHPSELGLPAYGEVVVTLPPVRRTGVARLSFDALRRALPTRSFAVLIGGFAVCGFTTNGLIQTHFIPLLQDHGITEAAAAGVFAMMAMFDFAGAIGAGYLTDRYDPRKLLLLYYVVRAIVLLLLPFSGFSGWQLALFGAFYGLVWIAPVPPTIRLTSESFGAAQGSLVFGWLFAGHQLGSAVAALGAGIVHDALGTYTPSFLLGGALCLVAGATALLLPRDGRPLADAVSDAAVLVRPAGLPLVAPLAGD
ncbi:MAG: MFS transporter [Rhodospirillales bacterium]|nr:MFS transporter [Rhodospirillales bacterium]